MSTLSELQNIILLQKTFQKKRLKYFQIPMDNKPDLLITERKVF